MRRGNAAGTSRGGGRGGAAEACRDGPGLGTHGRVPPPGALETGRKESNGMRIAVVGGTDLDGWLATAQERAPAS